MMKDVNGHLFGFIDASTIRMGWSASSVCLFEHSDLHETVEYNKKRYPGCDIFITRIHSKTCPIVVNYNKRASRQRNHLFSLK